MYSDPARNPMYASGARIVTIAVRVDQTCAGPRTHTLVPSVGWFHVERQKEHRLESYEGLSFFVAIIMSQTSATSAKTKKSQLAATKKRRLQAFLHKRAHPSTAEKAIKRKKSSTPSRAASSSKSVFRAAELPWKTITPALLSGSGADYLGFDAEGGMMELEEVEGVEVVYEEPETEGGRRKITFKVSSDSFDFLS
jgi:hypothetical protein